MITIKNEQTVPVNTDNLEKDANTILTFLGYADFDLGILLTDMAHMQQVNKKYRDKDKPTDILSFRYHEDIKAGQKIEPKRDEDHNLGDIIICPQYVKEDLDQWEQSFETRMQVLLVHGICHLLGYDHVNDDDYELMQKKEAEILAHLAKH